MSNKSRVEKINVGMILPEPISMDELSKAKSSLGLIVLTDDSVNKFVKDINAKINRASIDDSQLAIIEKAKMEIDSLTKASVVGADGNVSSVWLKIGSSSNASVDTVREYVETCDNTLLKGMAERELDILLSKGADEAVDIKKASENGLEEMPVVLGASMAFTDLVSSMHNVQERLEHCHRLTKSEPRHNALGEAYGKFAEFKDSIIEQIIGLTGQSYQSINLLPVPAYTPSMPLSVAEEICSVGEQVLNFAKAASMPSIENLAQDLCGVGAGLKYKLQLNDSDEKLVKAFESLGVKY